MISMRLSQACAAIQGQLSGEDRRFTGCSYDSRTLQPDELFIALRGEARDGHDFIPAALARGAGAALVDRDADYPLPVIRVNDARQQSGLLAAHWRARFDLPVIAVTGSNGKTTVKEMISAILSVHAEVLATRGNLNNDIGVPLTLFRLAPGHAYAVVEMGANHPGEISWLSHLARPQVALITQCAPAHLEGFGSVDGVAEAKAEIYAGLAPGGTAIVNRDDTYAGFWLERTRANRQITFGMDTRADVRAAGIKLDPVKRRTRFELEAPGCKAAAELSLFGAHNVMNALAAAACCHAVDVPLEQIITGLGRVRGVQGRMQLKAGRRGANIFDDSYNANPASLRAALEVACDLPGRCWLVLGDMGELGADAARLHEEAGAQARALGVERLYGIGELAAHAVAGFGAGAVHVAGRAVLIESLQADLRVDVVLLVKGSRSMALERVVDALAEEDA